MIYWLVIVLTAFAAVTCGILAIVLRRYVSSPGDSMYAVVAVGGFVWAGSYALSMLISDPAVHQLFEYPIWIGKVTITIAYFLFALDYTGRGDYITRPFVVAVSLPGALTPLAIATNGTYGLMWRSYDVVEMGGVATASYTYGPWFLAIVTFSYVLLAVGSVLLIGLLLKNRLYWKQAVVLLVATSLPSLTNIKRVFGLPPFPTLDLSPMVIAFTSAGIGYALFRHDLFSLSPATKHVGQRTAINDFADSVLIVDTEGRVVDLNERARELLDITRDVALGRGIEGLFDVDPFATESVVVQTVTGDREFDVTTSPLTDRHDRLIGHTVVLHDVTRVKRQQQRLSVLDRVLRHNIRNSMSVVMGCADEIARDGDGHADMARMIERRSASLMDISETARVVEEIIGRETERSVVDLSTLLADVEQRLREDLDSLTVTVEVQNPSDVLTDPIILEEVLYYAVRYLHSKAESNDFRVRLVACSGDDADSRFEIALVSEDATVPRRERAAVESGVESALEHTQHLDIWLVNWGIERIGGQLAFDQEIGTGETGAIVLTLPDIEARSTSPSAVEST